MGKSNPVVIAGKSYPSQKAANDFFNEPRKNLLASAPIKFGELFDALKDLYEQYCNNSPGYELNGRLIIAFSVEYETRHNDGVWASYPCYKVHFSNKEVRPFSVKKAIRSIANQTALDIEV